MRKTVYGLAAAALVAAPVAQAQDGAAVFKPTGGWTADYGDDYCRLIRTFSDGKDEVSLALERAQPGTPMRLVLVGNGVKVFRRADEIGYSFLPSGNSAKTRFARSETTDGNQYLNLGPVMLAPFAGFAPPPAGAAPAGPPPYNRAAEQETARAITTVAFGEGLTSPVRIETGSLGAPMTAMQNCADDLLKVWGLDPDKHKTMSASAVLNPVAGGVLPQGTIPFTEFAKFAGGGNDLRLIVGADGKPTSCTVRAPVLSQSMNEKICKLAMERASFQPAKDAGGEAMASYWMGSPLFLGPPPPGGRGR
jgi:hypothetical protein